MGNFKVDVFRLRLFLPSLDSTNGAAGFSSQAINRTSDHFTNDQIPLMRRVKDFCFFELLGINLSGNVIDLQIQILERNDLGTWTAIPFNGLTSGFFGASKKDGD